MSLGHRIRTLRTEKNLSLPDLALKSGLSKGLLSQIENSESANPSLETLNKIAKALSLTLATLLDKNPVRAKRVVPELLDPLLKEFLTDLKRQGKTVDEDILQALYVLQERKGSSINSKDDWRWLYESIEMRTKDKKE